MKWNSLRAYEMKKLKGSYRTARHVNAVEFAMKMIEVWMCAISWFSKYSVVIWSQSAISQEIYLIKI